MFSLGRQNGTDVRSKLFEELDFPLRKEKLVADSHLLGHQRGVKDLDNLGLVERQLVQVHVQQLKVQLRILFVDKESFAENPPGLSLVGGNTQRASKLDGPVDSLRRRLCVVDLLWKMREKIFSAIWRYDEIPHNILPSEVFHFISYFSPQLCIFPKLEKVFQ